MQTKNTQFDLHSTAFKLYCRNTTNLQINIVFLIIFLFLMYNKNVSNIQQPTVPDFDYLSVELFFNLKQFYIFCIYVSCN